MRNGTLARARTFVLALGLTVAVLSTKQIAAAQSICGNAGQLCALDTGRSDTCVVSETFVAELITRLGTGNVRDIAAQLKRCAEAGKRGAASCLSTDNCIIESTEGRCVADPDWQLKQLALPQSLGGAGLAARCGALGQFLGIGAVCAQRPNASFCENPILETSADDVPAGGCVWNAEKKVCGISQAALMVGLHRDYRDELAKVAMRRQECKDITDARFCGGYCQWSATPDESGGHCTLSLIEGLMSVAGEEACPLQSVVRQQYECGRIPIENTTHPEEACVAATTKGLNTCYWRDGECYADPLTQEFLLLHEFGMASGGSGSLLTSQFRTAHKQCRDIHHTVCNAVCAPAVQTGAASRPGRTAISSALVSLAALLGVLPLLERRW